jgi:hypothetical protein
VVARCRHLQTPGPLYTHGHSSLSHAGQPTLAACNACKCGPLPPLGITLRETDTSRPHLACCCGAWPTRPWGAPPGCGGGPRQISTCKQVVADHVGADMVQRHTVLSTRRNPQPLACTTPVGAWSQLRTTTRAVAVRWKRDAVEAIGMARLSVIPGKRGAPAAGKGAGLAAGTRAWRGRAWRGTLGGRPG